MNVATAPVILRRLEPAARVARQASPRLASIDWMRGVVMVLMVIDHASMAFDARHIPIALDSAMYAEATTMALPAAEFFTRWITHLCAPTFVFLAGTALALNVERRTMAGTTARTLDKNILVRGAVIAALDPTVVSLGSGKFTFQVLFAIGVAMMCMAALRRLSPWLLVVLAASWIAFGEFPTSWVWHPPGSSSAFAAVLIATYSSPTLVIKYPVIPWLAIMMLGWAFGQHLSRFQTDKATVSPRRVLVVAGIVALAVFAAVRGMQGFGDMFLHRTDNSWQQWLHVSKYPPSLTYNGLELGILWLALALMMTLEPVIGVRRNGVFLVFGQTAMFFYLVHRLALEVPATYFGLRGAGTIATTYVVSGVLITLLYPLCWWYRDFKASHKSSLLRYL
jgi:uncharacterized membrane protein